MSNNDIRVSNTQVNANIANLLLEYTENVWLYAEKHYNTKGIFSFKEMINDNRFDHDNKYFIFRAFIKLLKRWWGNNIVIDFNNYTVEYKTTYAELFPEYCTLKNIAGGVN